MITKVFVLILVISIVFVTYQSFYLEAFQEQVPDCGLGSGGSAPACYATVREDYNGFADVVESDYILKTQIVTPVCPNSPYTEWNDDALPNDKGYKYDTQDKDKEKNKEKDKNINQYGMNDFKPFDMRFNIDISNNKNGSTNEPTPNTPPSNQAAYQENAPIVNNQPIPDYNLSIPKANVPAEPASKEDKTSQPSTVDSNGSCPPCPACKRCPEPVVECKKVVNYKQAGADRLPVPLIADFSKF